MELPSTNETKDNLRLAWLSFLEAIYSFPPPQRLLLVGGIIMIIPAYWIFRIGGDALYSQTYKKYIPIARAAFTDPQTPEVGGLSLLSVGGGGYVAYAKVGNPNLLLSSRLAQYSARFVGESGQQVYQTSGQFYLLPGKETYIVVPRFRPSESPVSGAIQVGDVKWQKKFSIPEVKLTTPTPIVFSEKDGVRLEGVVVNNSPYKLGAVRIVVFVYDQSNRVVGVSDRSEFTVLPGERRAYVLHFPGLTVDQVRKIAPMAETNVGDGSNIQTPDGLLQFQDIQPKR